MGRQRGDRKRSHAARRHDIDLVASLAYSIRIALPRRVVETLDNPDAHFIRSATFARFGIVSARALHRLSQ